MQENLKKAREEGPGCLSRLAATESMSADLTLWLHENQGSYQDLCRWVLPGIREDNPRSRVNFLNTTRSYIESIARHFGQNHFYFYPRDEDLEKIFKAVDSCSLEELRRLMEDLEDLAEFCF